MDALNKFLSQAGACSRRHAVGFICQGLVTVNGKTVFEPGFKVPADAVVSLKGRKVVTQHKKYILMNKPKGFVTSCADEQNRQTVLDVLGKDVKVRVYPVGRLDKDTTGLLMLTNDGELAQKLAHPSKSIEKKYEVRLDKPVPYDVLERIRAGVPVNGIGLVMVDAIHYVSRRTQCVVRITIHTGQNRVVRRLFAQLGYYVIELDRIIYAGLTKKSLTVGKWRYLTEAEVRNLQSL